MAWWLSIAVSILLHLYVVTSVISLTMCVSGLHSATDASKGTDGKILSQVYIIIIIITLTREEPVSLTQNLPRRLVPINMLSVASVYTV